MGRLHVSTQELHLPHFASVDLQKVIIHISGLAITPHGSRTAELLLAFLSVLLLASSTASSLAPAFDS